MEPKDDLARVGGRKTVEELLAFLKENGSGFLATVDDQGRPHVRAMGHIKTDAGGIYYCTATDKEVFAQIKGNPRVELAVSTPDYSLNVRVSGLAIIDDNGEFKKYIIDNIPSLKERYRSADNPIFTTFYIKPERVKYWTFTSEPREVNLEA